MLETEAKSSCEIKMILMYNMKCEKKQMCWKYDPYSLANEDEGRKSFSKATQCILSLNPIHLDSSLTVDPAGAPVSPL